MKEVNDNEPARHGMVDNLEYCENSKINIKYQILHMSARIFLLMSKCLMF